MSDDADKAPGATAETLAELRREIAALQQRVVTLEGAAPAPPQDLPEDGLKREVQSLRARLSSVERDLKRHKDISKREFRAVWNHPAFRRLARFNPAGLKLLGLFGLGSPKDGRHGTSPEADPTQHSSTAPGSPGKVPAPESALAEDEESYLRGFSALTNVRARAEAGDKFSGRLVVDGARLFTRQLTGVGYYSEHLTRALLRRHPGTVSVYSSKPLPSWILGYGGRPAFVHMPPELAVNDPAKVAKAPTLASLAGPYDIYLHSTASYSPLIRADRTVSVIYDLAPIACPETVPESVTEGCKSYTRYLAKTSAHFVAISEYSKQSFVEFSGVAPDRVEVITVGIDPLFRRPVQPGDRDRVRARYGLDEAYIMCVGTLQPRKNLLRLLQAYGLLKERGVKLPRLVLAGSGTWAEMPEFEAALDRLRKSESASVTGYVDRADLPALYEGCEAFVYPSYFEGYGMPVAEAMACGAPVICSDRTSLPEVAGDAAVYCDPFSVEDIARAIESTLSDPAKLGTLRAKSFEQAETFPSWDDVADQFLTLFEKVAGSREK